MTIKPSVLEAIILDYRHRRCLNSYKGTSSFKRKERITWLLVIEFKGHFPGTLCTSPESLKLNYNTLYVQ